MNMAQAKLFRWMEILSSIDAHGYLTTSQIQRLHNLGGRRNTTRILADMADYLCSFREQETVYYLSAKGRKEIGSATVRRRTLTVQHSLIRNDVFLRYRPDYWRVELPIKWPDNTVIPDAVFRHAGTYYFLEVDLTQSLAANERKIALYANLRENGAFQRKYGHFPILMYVTVSEYRQKKLRALLDGFKTEVITFSDIK